MTGDKWSYHGFSSKPRTQCYKKKKPILQCNNVTFMIFDIFGLDAMMYGIETSVILSKRGKEGRLITRDI